jgi:hypothetical protein
VVCRECEYQAKTKINLTQHQAAVHKGILLIINIPGTKARYIPVTHVTIKQRKEDTLPLLNSQNIKKFPCDSCDYQANDRRNLSSHKQSKPKAKNIPVTYVFSKQQLLISSLSFLPSFPVTFLPEEVFFLTKKQ